MPDAIKQCSVEGCPRPHCGRGLCSMHYQRQVRTGEVGAAESSRRPSDFRTWRCASCKETKTREEFGVNRAAPGGRNWRCRACTRAANAAEGKSGRLRRRYGLTIEDFDQMLAAQGGVCAICEEARLGRGSWHVDHDHWTGRIRGILCPSCNTWLGKYERLRNRLDRIESYLT